MTISDTIQNLYAENVQLLQVHLKMHGFTLNCTGSTLNCTIVTA